VTKLERKFFRELIKAGINRNMVIFDGDAQPGQYTKRLLHLMRHHHKQNSTNMPIVQFWVNPKDLGRITYQGLVYPFPQYDTWLKYYFKLDATLAGGDTDLVIAYSGLRDGKLVQESVLLGSY
jgi:hypothetical protein